MVEISVAHIIGTLAIGGVEKRLLSLVRKQVDDPSIVEIKVIYFYDGNLVHFFNQIDSRKLKLVHCSSGYLARFYHLSEYIKTSNILHLYNFSGIFAGNLAALVTSGQKVILSHIGGISSVFSKRMRFIEKYMLFNTTQFIYNSNSTKSVFEYFGIKRKNSEVLHNGIELVAQSSCSNKDFNVFKFISVGRVTKNKNIEFNLRLIKELKEAGVLLEYDIIGDGPNLNEVRTLVSHLNLDSIVTIHGFIIDPLSSIAFHNSHFIFCCSFSETFGLSVVEAMSKGIVPIVSSIGGLPEVVTNDKSGLVLNSNIDISENVQNQIPVKKVWNECFGRVTSIKDVCLVESTEMILDVLKDEKRYNYLSENALKKSSRFSIDIYHSNVLKLYKRFLKCSQ